MKKHNYVPVITAVLLLLTAVACNDDPTFTQMKGIENQLYMLIRDYRTEQTLNTVTVNLDTMEPEAQTYSFKMATGIVEVGTEGLASHWLTIHDHWGGTNDVSVVMVYPFDGMNPITASMLLTAMKSDSAINAALLSDVSLCGVGIESDTTGNAYVTYLAMLVE